MSRSRDIADLGDNNLGEIVVDGSGNVGIGTASPSSFSGYTALTVNNATNGGLLEVQNNGTTYGQVFTDGSTFNIRSSASSSALVFDTNGGSERARIDSSGNLLINHTSKLTDASISSGATGIALRGDADVALISRDGGYGLVVNRKTSDGDIIDFRKDGSTVGSIASSGGTDLAIGSGDTGFRFIASANEIIPWNASGNTTNGDAINIGKDSQRFKDLYLSGGVYLGGTGAANKLDDYEEGTWTPTLGGTATYTEQQGKYIKVGGLVYITCKLTVNTIGTGSTNRIQGLPFTSEVEGALSSEALSNLAVTTSFITFRTAGADIYAFYATTATWNALAGNPSYLQSGTQIELAGCFKTTA